MNIKPLAIISLAVLPFFGCTSSDREDVYVDDADELQPVSFSTFISPDKTVTRAGDPSADLKTLRTNGFGVFAVNTGTSTYSDWRKANNPTTTENNESAPNENQASGNDPYDYSNYMFNQAVTWPKKEGSTTEPADDGSWSYSPIKYWPNPTITIKDGETKPQYVSFFAYSPYKKLTKYEPTTPGSSGNGTEGSGASTANGILGYAFSDDGDPLIAFNPVGSDVDLLWGTSGGTENGGYVDDAANVSNQGTNISPGTVAVNADIAKMKNGGTLKFNFKHALAKFNLTADTKVGDNLETVDPNSKVMIDYVVMVTKNQETNANVPTVMYLNLATGQFTSTQNGDSETSGDEELTHAIKATDKKDEALPTGITADASKTLNTELASVSENEIKKAAGGTGTTGTTPAKQRTRGNETGNEETSSEEAGSGNTSWDKLPSVTKVPKDIVDGGSNFMFIPDFSPDIEVYVKYHIYTKDSNYASTTGYVEVVQLSKAELEMGKLEQNKS